MFRVKLLVKCVRSDKSISPSLHSQILPYFVMHVLGYMRGVPGLFMACLFSGTLR